MRKLKEWYRRFIAWYRWRNVPKRKRIFKVYWSDSIEHIGCKIRGVPIIMKSTFIKPGEDAKWRSHFIMEVVGIERFNKKKCKELDMKEGYYVDGRYNDMKIERVK